MNPSFRSFDLNVYGPFLTRRDELMVKYWAKTESVDEHVLLIELQLHLQSLQFIGKSVGLPKVVDLCQTLTAVHSFMVFTIRYLRTASFSICQMVSIQALQIFPQMDPASRRPNR